MPDPLFSLKLKNMHKAKHGSDSGAQADRPATFAVTALLWAGFVEAFELQSVLLLQMLSEET